MPRSTLLILSLAFALVLAGCVQNEPAPPADDGDDEAQTNPPEPPPAEAEIPEYTFVATDFAFDGPDTIEGGWVKLVLRNDGRQLHHMVLERAVGNATYADFLAVLEAGPANATDENATEEPASPFESFPAPNAANPGGTVSATVYLEPGEYVIACWIPDPTSNMTPHALHGMHRPLVVTEANAAEEPEGAEATVVMDDFSFAIDANLTAGTHFLRTVNEGEEPHEVTVLKFEGNATFEDFLGWFADPQGPPPAEGLGGVVGVRPGVEAYFTTELEPGRYAFVCFFENEHGPHFAQGMIQNFEVA